MAKEGEKGEKEECKREYRERNDERMKRKSRT